MAIAYSASSLTVKDGAATADFTVKRSGTSIDLGDATSVDFSTQNVTAIAGTDYVATNGSLSFPAQSTEQTVKVAINQAAYDSPATRSFLLQLTGFGSATGNISPSSGGNAPQTYLFVPGDGEAVAIPTSETASARAKAQMRTDDWTAPGNDEPTSIKVPQTYLRIGKAGKNMNYYERIIAGSLPFFPFNPDKKDELGAEEVPEAEGTTKNFSQPRNVNRVEGGNQSVPTAELEETEDNEHLDGLFTFTQGSWTATVSGMASLVIQKDFLQSVGGQTRRTSFGEIKEAQISPVDGILLKASGGAKIGGLYTDYELSSMREIQIKAAMENIYNLALAFELKAAASINIENTFEHTVRNGAKLEISGLQVEGQMDISGNYVVEGNVGLQRRQRKDEDLSATDEITLQIDNVLKPRIKTAVRTLALANIAVGLAATAAAIAPFTSKEEFKKLAGPDHLEETFADFMNDGFPITMATLGALTAAALVIVAAFHHSLTVAAGATSPTIKMDRHGTIELSVNPANSIVISNAGITMTGTAINLTGPTTVTGSATVNGPATAQTLTVTGPTNLNQGATILGRTTVDGQVVATQVAVGV